MVRSNAFHLSWRKPFLKQACLDLFFIPVSARLNKKKKTAVSVQHYIILECKSPGDRKPAVRVVHLDFGSIVFLASEKLGRFWKRAEAQERGLQ
jgi:hypothetical protein